MVDIEPFTYQKSTNIDEHNQIVNKLNEVVDVINDTNLDTITPEIDALKTATTKNTTDISQLKISDAEHTEQIATIDGNIDNHAREITALKAKDATHDTEIAELDKVTDALTKEIPNGITLYRDGTGKIKAVISQEDDTTIDSNVLDMIIPYQYDIISGTTSRSFKLDITMSDGAKYTTNDFVIPAGGGTSVSITAITLTKNADNPNRFKVSVKLDDGSTIDSGEIEMVTSVSGSFANNKLTITVNGVSSTPITIDATGTVYTAGDSVSITDGTIDVKVMSDGGLISTSKGLAVLKDYTGFVPGTDYVSLAYNDNEFGFAEGYQLLAATDNRTGVMTEADHKAFTQMKTTIGDCFNAVALGSDGKSLDFTAVDGQVNNVALPSSGDWKICDVLPTSSDWENIMTNDFMIFITKISVRETDPPKSFHDYRTLYHSKYGPTVGDLDTISDDTYICTFSGSSIKVAEISSQKECTRKLSSTSYSEGLNYIILTR